MSDKPLNEYLAGVSEDQVLAVTRAVVAEYGEDYVYAKQPDPRETEGVGLCLYVSDGKPSCIVGHIAARLGVPLDVLHDVGDLHVEDDTVMTWGAAAVLMELGTSERIAEALSLGQESQDLGVPWGRVLTEIERGLGS